MTTMIERDRLLTLMCASPLIGVEIVKFGEADPYDENGKRRYCTEPGHDINCAWVIARWASWELIDTLEATRRQSE